MYTKQIETMVVLTSSSSSNNTTSKRQCCMETDDSPISSSSYKRCKVQETEQEELQIQKKVSNTKVVRFDTTQNAYYPSVQEEDDVVSDSVSGSSESSSSSSSWLNSHDYKRIIDSIRDSVYQIRKEEEDEEKEQPQDEQHPGQLQSISSNDSDCSSDDSDGDSNCSVDTSSSLTLRTLCRDGIEHYIDPNITKERYHNRSVRRRMILLRYQLNMYQSYRLSNDSKDEQNQNQLGHQQRCEHPTSKQVRTEQHEQNNHSSHNTKQQHQSLSEFQSVQTHVDNRCTTISSNIQSFQNSNEIQFSNNQSLDTFASLIQKVFGSIANAESFINHYFATNTNTITDTTSTTKMESTCTGKIEPTKN